MYGSVLSSVGVRRIHVQERCPSLCLFTHRAVVVRRVKYGRVQVLALRLAAVTAVEAVVAVAAVWSDALTLVGTVVETGAVGRATVLGRPAVVTRALFQPRALAVSSNVQHGSQSICDNHQCAKITKR